VSSTTYLIKSARILGGEPTDILIADGVIASVGRGGRSGDRHETTAS
jgi:dihydroorotase